MSRRKRANFLGRISQSRGVYRITIPKRIVEAYFIDEYYRDLSAKDETAYCEVTIEI